ncbi:MAG: flagellar biosynthesis protein FlhA [Leptolyngbya sp. PLA2]|nr:flagellar biosynthesis protein FlhA [Leptolyngbya sp.]MCE7971592.1 flagellar biosynthesis protein FlhA [Leptolyngbya sp. PL-A2]MCZ7632628.1 flagellar biosynthesis protein FlhA [Phycisphaerales bacterium]MDL1904919.1 flagellar biosynthesis protein FlhA [Synechococcales cyanobacterium CNB]GIK19817.1 MAG: flagellar biosynthesis protein FlhA [Planctomycetota bacterium]
MAPTNPPQHGASNGSGLPAWLLALAKHRGLIVPIAFVMLMVVILVPLPPPALDLLISLNISLSVIVLLTTISMGRPLEFSVFPSLLLATTMFRLVLNIASTRLILTADAGSPEEAIGVAGQVISAFGEFVAGDSLFVGVVIFLILIIVQFVVVTKGATRISEVAARFTLDAMPGKQMAIDSDLNAGLINEAEARRRREDISREADFFGAMDGASKFVRGDAIAGIIITAVNIIGGFAVGTIERGWPAGQSAEVFTKLTIGDGLTSQIPSFVVSIAAALIVTRSGSKQQLGDELTGQLTSQPRGLAITAAFLALLAFSPLPTLPLLATAAGLGALAWAMTRSSRAETAREQSERASAPPEPPPIETLLKVDVLELEVGYALVSLVDTQQGGDLLDRIQAIRRQMAAEAGFVMPPVRIRDNMQLEPTEYRIKVRGAETARGNVRPGRLLAMDSGLASAPIDGEPTKEPAFGLDAWWIDPAMRARAESMNYTVVDPTSVVATHLTEVVRANAADLLTREEVNNLLEGLRQRTPKLVEETVPGVVKTADLQKVLQNLLRERVPIRDVETILETLGDWAPKTQDPDVLTEYVRNALRRTICEQVAAPGTDGKRTIVCVTLDPSLEDQVAAYIDRGPAGTSVTMPARVAGAIAGQIVRALEKVTAAGRLPVVVASPQVRAVVRQIVEPHLPSVVVLGYNEVASPFEVESLSLVTPPKQHEPAVTAA